MNSRFPADRYTKHSRELAFTIVAEVLPYRVDFTILDIAGWVESKAGGGYDVPRWAKVCSPDSTDCLETAEGFLHGHVKWDGCSNWHFDEQDRAMLHGCSRADLQRLGDVMAMCWDWAAELLPNWAP